MWRRQFYVDILQEPRHNVNYALVTKELNAISKFEKARERLLAMPRDYTYTEARVLLGQLGFQESNKGKTSGARVKFYRMSDKKGILLHKPHPGDIMSRGCVKDLVEFLTELGEL